MAISLKDHEDRITALENKIGEGTIQGIRWSSARYKVVQVENNNSQVWEKGAGYVVTAVTYGEGPNTCPSQNRILQVNIGGTWTDITYSPSGGYYPPLVSEVSYYGHLA